MVSLVRASSLYGYEALARRLGIDGPAALQRVGLPGASQREPDDLVPYAAVAALLELSADWARCPDVGLQLAREQGLGILGPVSALVRHAPTVGEALMLASRYLFVHSPAVRLDTAAVAGHPDQIDLCLELTLPGPPRLVQVHELSLALLVEGLRHHSQGAVRPVLVQLPHARQGSLATYARAYGCAVRFEAPRLAVRVRAADLLRPLAEHDPLMQDLTQRYLDQHFSAGAHSVTEQVRTLVRHALGSGDCSRAAVARALGLHPRRPPSPAARHSTLAMDRA